MNADGPMSYPYNPSRWVAFRALIAPDDPAFTVYGEAATTSYATLDLEASRLASRFAELGVAAGERVAYLGQNERTHLLVALATWRLGATFMPLNYRLPAAELDVILSDAEPYLLVAGRGYESLGSELVYRVGAGGCVATQPGSDLPDLLSRLDRVPRRAEFAATRPDDAAALLYTSGTSGIPKGVIWSFSNIWWAVTTHAQATGGSAADVDLVSGPLVLAGPLFMLLSTWLTGGHIVTMQKFEPERALAAIARHRVTIAATSPLILRMLADSPDFPESDLRSIRYLVVGGGPITPELLGRFVARNIRITQGYGMTETAGVGTFLPPELIEAKLGSAGLPLPMTEIKIAAADGGPAKTNEPGEILVRAPHVMAGYWHRNGATQEAIDVDGWLHTGDAGRLDADGHLWVIDRIKDMIITGGLNVYAAEVEHVLSRLPEVAEVAVVGLPDERYGELVAAVIVARGAGSVPSLEELRDGGRSELAGYKLPRRLIVLPELPRNASGKVLKREIVRSLKD
jgi:fatty-acyl-CoA synthase